MTFRVKLFVISDFKNVINRYLLVILPIVAKLHSQATEIQPSEVECFFMQMLKFREYDIIIYYVSVDFEILFNKWNSLVMSYPVQNFTLIQSLMTELLVFLIFFFCAFLDKRQRSQYRRIFHDVTSPRQCKTGVQWCLQGAILHDHW